MKQDIPELVPLEVQPMPPGFRRKLAAAAGLVLVIIVTVALRWDSLWLAHWLGDQSHFVTLAMKLDAKGLKEYNLRNASIGLVPVPRLPAVRLVYPRYVPEKEGTLLKALNLVGYGYYDEPLHSRPPLFAYALMMSHRWLSQPLQPFTVCTSNLGREVARYRSPTLMRSQLWATLPVLIFHLMIVAMIYALALKNGGVREALYASLIFSTSAVSLFVSQKVLAEDLMTLLMFGSLIMFGYAYDKRKTWGFAVSGLLAGLSFVTKQNSVYLCFILWSFIAFDSLNAASAPSGSLWSSRRGKGLVVLGFTVFAGLLLTRPGRLFYDGFFAGSLQAGGLIFCLFYIYFIRHSHSAGRGMGGGFFASLFDRRLILFGLGFAAVAGLWVYEVIRVYGSPFHLSFAHAKVSQDDVSGWLKMLGLSLPPILYFSLGTLYLTPAFVFALAAKRGSSPHDSARARLNLLLWLCVIVFFLSLAQPWRLLWVNYNQEHRYFYPAYPAWALLAAQGANRLRSTLVTRGFNPAWAEFVTAGLLLAAALWSIPQGQKPVYENLMFVG